MYQYSVSLRLCDTINLDQPISILCFTKRRGDGVDLKPVADLNLHDKVFPIFKQLTNTDRYGALKASTVIFLRSKRQRKKLVWTLRN